MNTTPALSLFELNALVRQTIEQRLNREYWVEAELSECRETRGHCYMELIQKDPRSATPIARAQARCWRSQWQLLQPYFERATGQTLHAGLKVLLKVYAQFHEAFGFSWIVTDIDPTFTLGDMARRRQEIIYQLKQEGVFDLQKELALPVFCQRIAVISSATAAGYGDFVKQLNENTFGLHFQVTLFPAIMQGEQVEQSIIAALDAIYQLSNPSTTQGEGLLPFDCVVILRGGGATADLSGFDTLALAENVAQFPLPIITAIGHDRDESILDMVSHLRVKTPTAAASFLIAHLEQVLVTLDDCQARISHHAQQRLTALHAQIATLQEIIPRLFSVVKARQETRLNTLHNRLLSSLQQRVATEGTRLSVSEQKIHMLLSHILMAQKAQLALLEEKVKALDPAILLHRGYSITMKDGHAVRDPQQLADGDEIVTRLEKGVVKSTVIMKQ
jgi:exodeoxyribonuclease VII large subunit